MPWYRFISDSNQRLQPDHWQFKKRLTAMIVLHIGSHKGMVETFGDDVVAFVFSGDV